MTGTRITTAPLRTLLMLASFAVTAYAGVRMLDGGQVFGIVVWFVGAALLHDLVLLPLYGLADRALRRGPGRAGGSPVGVTVVNHVRVPAFVSGVLFLVWYPLILGLSQNYRSYSTLDPGVFWQRWLLLTAGLFAASAALFALRSVMRARSRRRDAARAAAGGGDGDGDAR